MMTDESACHPLDDLEKARESSLALWRQLDLGGKPAGASADGFPASERRALDLTGRYQVGDGNEFACEVPEVSPLGLCIRGPKIGRVGDWCLANVVSVGIVEGVVVLAQQHAFVVGVLATPRRIRRLADRLSWQLRRYSEEVSERRSSQRIEMNAAEGRLETIDGQVFECRIFDMSEGGAALHLGPNALYFWVDQPLVFDGRPARVLRIFPGGFVIKFD